MGAARFDLDGEKLTRDQVLNRLYSPDRALRQRAAASVTAGLKEAQRTNTFIFNTILADKASDDRLRNYPDMDQRAQPGQRGGRPHRGRRWSRP